MEYQEFSFDNVVSSHWQVTKRNGKEALVWTLRK